MAKKLYSAIYFDSQGKTDNLPVDKYGNKTIAFDWVDSKINGIGKQETSLYCRAMPRRKIEDFYEYFSRNEIIWYKFILSRASNILKILRVHSFDLNKGIFDVNYEPFPVYEYKLASFVTDVDKTDDDAYETYSDFYIQYHSGFTPSPIGE